jgi:MerR family transcriptional regulator, heat shock protein HspR
MGMTRDAGVYIISVAAELAGVHPQTLRTYERKGLLTPKRTSGGTRRYSERDVARVQLIQQLTQAEGVNLAGVLRILELEDEVDRLRRRLERAQRDLEDARAESQAALREAQRRAGTELVLYRRTQIERHRSGR